MKEFTPVQTERIDEIDNAVFDLCKVMLEDDDLEWDMEIIGEVADAVTDILVEKGHRVRYPALVCSEDGDGVEIIDYVEPKTIMDEPMTIDIKLCNSGEENKNKRIFSDEDLNN